MEKEMIKFFSFDHLPKGDLRDTSREFYFLATKMDMKLPDNPEKEMMLRKLLEAKDCAVRAWLYEGDADAIPD
jgi:ferritin-like protein